ncbi:MAG: Phosphohydrolase (MutT/nudix family protein), partial [uncultured Thermomicrobiales bacterium]
GCVPVPAHRFDRGGAARGRRGAGGTGAAEAALGTRCPLPHLYRPLAVRSRRHGRRLRRLRCLAPRRRAGFRPGPGRPDAADPRPPRQPPRRRLPQRAGESPRRPPLRDPRHGGDVAGQRPRLHRPRRRSDGADGRRGKASGAGAGGRGGGCVPPLRQGVQALPPLAGRDVARPGRPAVARQDVARPSQTEGHHRRGVGRPDRGELREAALL